MQSCNRMNEDIILPCMDMQWISEYPNEQEIFFMGGLRAFEIGSIIEASTGCNYVKYIAGLKTALQGTGTEGNATQVFNPSYQNDNRSTFNEQIAFRLLSAEIHRYFPTQLNAHQFEKCPTYIKTLMQTHCNNVVFVDLMHNADYNIIMDYFFIDKKTHCVNL
eukprot:104579_1